MATPIKVLGFETRSAWDAGTSLTINPAKGDGQIPDPAFDVGSQGGSSVSLRLEGEPSDDDDNGFGLNVDWDFEQDLPHFIMHFKFKCGDVDGREFRNGSSTWLFVLKNSSGTKRFAFYLQTDGTFIGSVDTDGLPSSTDATGTIVNVTENVWYSAEVEVITGSSGKIHFKINGLTIFEHSINTLDTVGLRSIGFSSGYNINTEMQSFFDDFYLYVPDSTGGFLGPVNVYESMPTGDATTSAWTKSSDGSTGDIYTMVDETTEGGDGDTTYGTTETTGAKALFNLTYPQTLTGDIIAVEYENTIRHETTEKNWVPHRVTDGTAIDDGTSTITPLTYETNKQLLEINIPNANANGTVFGIRRID